MLETKLPQRIIIGVLILSVASVYHSNVAYNKYKVITIGQEEGDKQVYRTLLVTTIIDLVILNPILIKIQYID